MFLYWFVFFCSKNHSSCGQANANAFRFFTSEIDLPGPTMSFSESLNQGIFEFEFKTFVDRALMLYQDDQGETDYIRFVNVIFLLFCSCFA